MKIFGEQPSELMGIILGICVFLVILGLLLIALINAFWITFGGMVVFTFIVFIHLILGGVFDDD